MTDRIVVTLEKDVYCQDYELPWKTPLCELNPRLLIVLQKDNPRLFEDVKAIVLEIDGAGMLDEDSSLFDYGICAGARLSVVEREKYDNFPN